MKKKIFLLTALLALCVVPCLSACETDQTSSRNVEKVQTRITDTEKNPDEECPDGNCPETDDGKDEKCPRCKHGMPNARRHGFKIPVDGEVRIFEINFNEYGFPFRRHVKPAPEPEIPVPEDPEQPSTETGD